MELFKKRTPRRFLTLALAIVMVMGLASTSFAAFSDIPEDYWAKDYIDELAERKIINGYPDGSFGPNDPVKRQHVAKMIALALELELGDDATEFTDVPVGNEFVEYIVATNEAGIFIGSEGKFGWNDLITRRQIANVIVRAFDLEMGEIEVNFTDINFPNDPEAEKNIKILASNGIVGGYEDGTEFRPNEGLRRAQFAQILVEAEKIANQTEVEEELIVESVSAITLTSVTVEITELAEDLKDANVVVRNAAGQLVPTIAQDLAAGTTEATFYFATPLTFNPGGDWTVNGVKYDAGEFAVVAVDALTNSGKYIEVIFNQPVESLHASELAIRDSVNLSRVGIEDVRVSTDGMSAQVTLLGDERILENILEPNREYTLSITKNGEVSSFKFEIPDAVEEKTITSYNLKNRTIKIGTKTLEFPESTSVDFEYLLGREATVWFNSDEEVTRYVLTEETVKYDAVEWDAKDKELKLVTEDETYELADDYQIRVNGGSGNLNDYDYAKVVFDNRNEVKFINAYNWDESFVVNKVEDTIAIGYKGSTEVDLKDFVIVKDGNTISIEDIEQGDILFYNATANNGKNEKGYAEVFNGTVTGEIEQVYRDEIVVNGEYYKYRKDSADIVKYLDGNEIKNADHDQMEAFQKGGEVTLYLNREGDLIYITGEQAEIAKTTLASHLVVDAVTYNNNHDDRGIIELEYVNEEGKKVLDVVNLRQVKKIKVYSLNANGQRTAETFEVDEKINNTGEEIDFFRLAVDNPATESVTNIDEVVIEAKRKGAGTDAEVVELADVAKDNSFIKVTKDDDGNVIELEFYKQKLELLASDPSVELDANFIKGARLQSDTVVFDGSAGYDSDATGKKYNPKTSEIEVTTWGELKDKGFKIEIADVYVDADGYVDYLVIQKTDASDTTPVNALVTEINRDKDNYVQRLVAFVDGEEQEFTFTKNLRTTAEKGSVIRLTTLDANPSKVSDIEAIGSYQAKADANVDAINLNQDKITVDGKEFDIRNASFLDAKDFDDIKTISRSRINKDDTVHVILEEAGSIFVDMIILVGSDSSQQTDPDVVAETYIVTYINDTRIFIDGERYAMDEDTVLYDKDGKTVKHVGGENINSFLTTNSLVKDVEVKDNVVTEMTLVKTAEEIEEEEAAKEKEEADKKAAADVVALIEALEEPTEDNLEDVKAAVAEVKEALEALNEEARLFVSEEALAELEAVEAKIEELEELASPIVNSNLEYVPFIPPAHVVGGTFEVTEGAVVEVIEILELEIEFNQEGTIVTLTEAMVDGTPEVANVTIDGDIYTIEITQK